MIKKKYLGIFQYIGKIKVDTNKNETQNPDSVLN